MRSASDLPARPRPVGCRRACRAACAPHAIHGCAREILRQGHAVGPLGDGRRAACARVSGYFPRHAPLLPARTRRGPRRAGGLPGILGDRHAPGVAIIEELGEEHLRTGKPIVYTSVDSVLQIAAHEEAFGLERLYETCRIARNIADRWNVGRVIARPFVGTTRADFRRTPHRKDFAIPPPPGNLLDRAEEAGRAVLSLGKIGDIFGHRATGREIKGANNDASSMRFCANGRDAGRRARLRQSRRFRHRVRPPPRCGRLCGGAGGLRRAPAGHRTRRCATAICC